MNLDQQKALINLFKQYQQTDSSTIKANIRQVMDKQPLKPAAIAKQTGISIHTIRELRKTTTNNYKPDFLTAVILCDALKISITATMQVIPGIEQPEQKQTKWTDDIKRKFIVDYNSLTVDELCKKYSITPRTAQEYNKNFIRDFEW